MTETQTGETTGQSANGQAPAPPPADPAPDTGERVLGALVIAAGIFLLIVGVDRVTGGRLSAGFYREDGDGAGG